MAAKGAREPITLECTECKRRTYMTEKNKKGFDTKNPCRLNNSRDFKLPSI